MADDPRMAVRCEYPETPLDPTEVTFGLSPHYGIHTAREAHAWFLRMMREHEEFEVGTDRAGDLRSFLSREITSCCVTSTAVITIIPSNSKASGGSTSVQSSRFVGV